MQYVSAMLSVSAGFNNYIDIGITNGQSPIIGL